MNRLLLVAVLLLTASAGAFAQAVTVDAKLPEYTPVAGVSGNLSSVGSDTLNNCMTLWAEAFQKLYPNVKIQIEGKGSGTAPPALIAGTAQLGPMSRDMKSTESDLFEAKFGYKPTRVRVSIDALAVFVHKDNPLKGVNLEQLDSVFSSTYKRGAKDVSKWGQLSLEGQWASLPITLYGRNSASGTYGYFKEHVLSKGDYKTTVKEQPGSSAVVQAIATTLGGMGYSGIGYKTSGVRALPVAEKGTEYQEPTYENCLNGKYPIARFLVIYVNKRPNEKLDTLTYELLRFVTSKQGQEIVVKDGFFPLPAEVAKPELEQLLQTK